MKRALVIWGGWEGHRPAEVAGILAAQLRAQAFEVTVSEALESLQAPSLGALDLIAPVWSLGVEPADHMAPLLAAVEGGVGLATLHGGINFFQDWQYAFMIGGQFVCHPGGDGVTYTVHIDGAPSPITEGLTDFEIASEQYYLHVDPGNTVLATTRFGAVAMPVAWVRHYGKGRVFYCSLAHTPEQIQTPAALAMITRGMLWAAGQLG